MNGSQYLIAISIVVLAVIAVVVIFMGKSRKENRLTPLASLAFVFIFTGIVLGNGQWFGYSLFGVGMILAVVDIILKFRKRDGIAGGV